MYIYWIWLSCRREKKIERRFTRNQMRKCSSDARTKILPTYLSLRTTWPTPIWEKEMRDAFLLHSGTQHLGPMVRVSICWFPKLPGSRAAWSPENWIRDGTSWDSRRSLRAILESLLLATASLSCSTKYTSAPFRARTLGIKSNQLTNFRGFRHENNSTYSCFDLTDYAYQKYT